jgi:hypothetical protein
MSGDVPVSLERFDTMPSAFDIAGPISDARVKRRVATNQAILRRVNEAIRLRRADNTVVLRWSAAAKRRLTGVLDRRLGRDPSRELGLPPRCWEMRRRGFESARGLPHPSRARP